MKSTRMENINNLTKYASEIKLIIPMSVFREMNQETFQEQQEALENLKKDPRLIILESEDKNDVVTIDGIQTLNYDKIITIAVKQ